MMNPDLFTPPCSSLFLPVAKTSPPPFLPTWGACTRPVSACWRRWRVLHSGSIPCGGPSPLPGLCWPRSWCGPGAPPPRHWAGAATASLVNRHMSRCTVIHLKKQSMSSMWIHDQSHTGQSRTDSGENVKMGVWVQVKFGHNFLCISVCNISGTHTLTHSSHLISAVGYLQCARWCPRSACLSPAGPRWSFPF